MIVIVMSQRTGTINTYKAECPRIEDKMLYLAGGNLVAGAPGSETNPVSLTIEKVDIVWFVHSRTGAVLSKSENREHGDPVLYGPD